MLRVGRGRLPEEYREYRACTLFGLTQAEYAAMSARTLDLWFEFRSAEIDAQEAAEREANR